VLGISERQACWAIGPPRSTQRHERKVPDDEERLVGQIVRLATQYGRYGFRRITALLRNDGWQVNHKRFIAYVSGRASRCLRSSPNGAGCSSMLDPVSA
jgi:hypothetical protein